MTLVVLAQESSALPSLVFLALMVGIFYFLIVRPQRRRARAQQELASSLEIGHEVRTVGGIHGTVIALDEDSVILGVEDGRLRVARRAIGARVDDDEA